MWIFIPIVTLSFVSKKQDWYILASIPALSLFIGNSICFFWEKKKILRRLMLFIMAVLIVIDYYYLSFFANIFSGKTSLFRHFEGTDILKPFDLLLEFKFSRTDESYLYRIKDEIFAEIRRRGDVKQVNIFNNYELFKCVSYYSLLEEDIDTVFYFVRNQDKDNYEIVNNY
jgi:hypothetical protein